MEKAKAFKEAQKPPIVHSSTYHSADGDFSATLRETDEGTHIQFGDTDIADNPICQMKLPFMLFEMYQQQSQFLMTTIRKLNAEPSKKQNAVCFNCCFKASDEIDS